MEVVIVCCILSLRNAGALQKKKNWEKTISTHAKEKYALYAGQYLHNHHDR